MSYIIVKMIKVLDETSKKLPVVLVDSTSEVMEFETYEEAEDMCTKFQINSDSGWDYMVKKVGSK
jgi:hypothetical protein